MLKLLQETFFLPKPSTLSRARHKAYKTALITIVALHLVFFALVGTATYYKPASVADPVSYFFTLLQIVSIASGIVVIFLSLKSEVLISQSYDLALSSSQTTSHTFADFKQHLSWLKQNISTERFPEVDRLVWSFSTPLYGIGDDGQTALEFLEYLESWVDHFEKSPSVESTQRPRWEITVWDQESNKIFKDLFLKNARRSDKEKLSLVDKLASCLERLYKLYSERRIDLFLHYSAVSHARIFFVEGRSKSCHGLICLFSPLTPSAISSRKWMIVGFSFRDDTSLVNIHRFNERLQQPSFEDARPINHVDALKQPRVWILSHYGIPVDSTHSDFAATMSHAAIGSAACIVERSGVSKDEKVSSS